VKRDRQTCAAKVQIRPRNFWKYDVKLTDHGNRSGHGIMAMAAPGIAGKDTPECQPSAFKNAVFPERLYCILGAGRCIAALGSQQGRQELLVKPDEKYEEPADHMSGLSAGVPRRVISLPIAFFTATLASSKLNFSAPL